MRSTPSLRMGDRGGIGKRLASALGLCQVCRLYCSHADAPVDKLLSAGRHVALLQTCRMT